MEYCAPRGIPRSVFLSWAVDDQHAALEWSLRKRRACSSCGTRPEEWDPELGGHPRAYSAEITTCAGCAAVELGHEHMQRLRDRDKDRVGRGAGIGLRRQVVG